MKVNSHDDDSKPGKLGVRILMINRLVAVGA